MFTKVLATTLREVWDVEFFPKSYVMEKLPLSVLDAPLAELKLAPLAKLKLAPPTKLKLAPLAKLKLALPG